MNARVLEDMTTTSACSQQQQEPCRRAGTNILAGLRPHHLRPLP